jgi:ketosteroid isomerase-like protein
MKKELLMYALLFPCWVTDGACQSLQMNDLPAERKMIEKHNKIFFEALEKKDAKTFSNQFAMDCWIMLPNSPDYCGPDAATNYFHEVLLKKGIAHGKFILTDLYGIDSEIMAEVGFYQLYDKSNNQFDDGKYLVLWKRTNGQWQRFKEIMLSSRKN